MSGGSRGFLLSSCAAAVLFGGIAAGCGNGDGESTAKEEGAGISVASESPQVFIERMAKLLQTTTAKSDCAALEVISRRSHTRFECPAGVRLRKSMAKFEVVGEEVYGTGAVVDYKSGHVKDGAAILLFIAPDRSWGISRFGVVTEPSTGTSDADSRDGYDEVVDEYLTAVRERDCKAFDDVAYTGKVPQSEICEKLFTPTERLAKRLENDPSARPEYEGGNARYGFYTLETQKPTPESQTISVIKAGDAEPSYLVLDLGPSPTAAARRRIEGEVRKQLKQQQKKKGGSSSQEPSSKPSDPSVKG